MDSHDSVDSLKDMRVSDIGMDDIVKKIYKVREELESRVTFCINKITQMPAIEQKVQKLLRSLMTQEQRSE